MREKSSDRFCLSLGLLEGRVKERERKSEREREREQKGRQKKHGVEEIAGGQILHITKKDRTLWTVIYA